MLSDICDESESESESESDELRGLNCVGLKKKRKKKNMDYNSSCLYLHPRSGLCDARELLQRRTQR